MPLYSLDMVLQVTGEILQFFLKKEKKADVVSVRRTDNSHQNMKVSDQEGKNNLMKLYK